MKITFLSYCLLFGLVISAQSPDTSVKPSDTFVSIKPIQYDSLFDVNVTGNDDQRQQDMDRNMRSILDLQQKNRAKQKKEAMVRIAIGVGFLVLLVVGLMRRRKKQ